MKILNFICVLTLMPFFSICCVDQKRDILGTWRHVEGSFDSRLITTFSSDGTMKVEYDGLTRVGKYRFDGKNKVECAGENGKYETYLLKDGKIYVGGSYPYVLERK